MAGNTFTVLDPTIRPRSGQQVLLDHFGQRIRGTVHSVTTDLLRIQPDSFLLARRWPIGTRMEARLVTGHGLVGATLRLITQNDQFLTTQLVELPTVLQRRADPRVRVSIEMTLTWPGDQFDALHQAAGRTQNLSLGGALLRFTTPQPLLSEAASPLLSLALPDGCLSVAVRVLQVFDTGVRVRFLDPAAAVRSRLSAMLTGQLE